MEREVTTMDKQKSKEISNLNELEVYESLMTTENGLNSEEAAKRLITNGRNILQKAKGKPLILRFLANFVHLMAILLWVGGIVGFVAGMPQLGVAIWLVNIINGVFSFWQEYRAEKATEALQKMLPEYACVLRNGVEDRILADELVPGDIIILAEGDLISADCRVVEASDLRVNQSTFTGESNPIAKTKAIDSRKGISISEKKNLIFAGTSVASGSGRAVVYSTGMKTEFGRIAGLTQNTHEEESPLQKQMGKITRLVSMMAISIGVFFFIMAVFVAKVDIAESFIFGMGMIVAFVPEGLLPTVTLSLAMGVQRMAKRNALIKHMPAVETLGCTTVICTDKTGTLTQNEMTVTDIWIINQELKVTGGGYKPEGSILKDGKPIDYKSSHELNQILIAASLCNNSHIVKPDEYHKSYTVLGDPTEASLKVATIKAGIDLEKLIAENKRLRELPFESNRKRMSTIHNADYGKVAYIKGSPKEVIDLCSSYYFEGQQLYLTEELVNKAMAANDMYARKGLRVLAIAMRRITEEDELFSKEVSEYNTELVEQKLIFLGLMAMEDPPRPQVRDAVQKCNNAGIGIVMITGDYGLTAESIARDIGIVNGDNPKIISGVELDKIDDSQLKEALNGEVIFARVAPEQKLRVVSTLQQMGHVVAVTGDGVNDAPALKKADIGVAMGVSGTDVAKEAADMILTDDNFASIVNAVEEGRAVYNNIRRFITYIFNSNLAEAVPFVIFLFSQGNIPLALTVMQVLSIDLGTDMLPAIALGAELPEAGIMNAPPRSRSESLLNSKILARAFLWYGAIESIIAMGAFFFLYFENGVSFTELQGSGTIYMMATTMTLAAIVFGQIGAVFSCRTEKTSLFKVGFFTNRLVLIGVAFELILLSVLIYVPFFNDIFNTAPIGIKEWLYLIIWAPLIILLDEIRKKIARRKDKK
jgi:magnesium-transporting ATPase (P-type)